MSELTPKVILGVAAHPDDLEFGVAGSIAKWVAQGATAYYLVCTDGSKGSAEVEITSSQLVKLRQTEQRAAAKILGVKEVFFLDYEDGTIECSLELKRDIARIIRQLKPDVVLTMDPTFVYSVDFGFINHTDHRAVGMATLDAVYPLARDHLSFPELAAKGFAPHKVKNLLLMNFEKSNYCIDITKTFEVKVKALLAHQSQISDTSQTPQFLRQRAQEAGKQLGCELAEAFVRIDLPD